MHVLFAPSRARAARDLGHFVPRASFRRLRWLKTPGCSLDSSYSGVLVPATIFVAGFRALARKQASGLGGVPRRPREGHAAVLGAPDPSSFQQGNLQSINQLRRRLTWAKRLDTSRPIARSTAHTHSRACPSFTASSSPPRMYILHDCKRRPPLPFCGREAQRIVLGADIELLY